LSCAGEQTLSEICVFEMKTLPSQTKINSENATEHSKNVFASNRAAVVTRQVVPG